MQQFAVSCRNLQEALVQSERTLVFDVQNRHHGNRQGGRASEEASGLARWRIRFHAALVPILRYGRQEKGPHLRA
jgi:hypothetical protein